jgi:hypothetical protein
MARSRSSDRQPVDDRGAVRASHVRRQRRDGGPDDLALVVEGMERRFQAP